MSGGWLTALVGLGALALAFGAPVALPALEDVMDRGARLSVCTVDDAGVVLEQPAELAEQMSAAAGRAVSSDACSLARMVRSEDGSAGQIAKVYKCHVAANQANALGWGITQVITYHTASARAGRYGAQITGRFASGQDPYESDLAAAEHALAQRAAGEDPTSGATNFVDVGAFGVQLGTGTFTAIVERWGAEGKVPGRLPDTPMGLVFFWRGSVPSIAEEIT